MFWKFGLEGVSSFQMFFVKAADFGATSGLEELNLSSPVRLNGDDCKAYKSLYSDFGRTRSHFNGFWHHFGGMQTQMIFRTALVTSDPLGTFRSSPEVSGASELPSTPELSWACP